MDYALLHPGGGGSYSPSVTVAPVNRFHVARTILALTVSLGAAALGLVRSLGSFGQQQPPQDINIKESFDDSSYVPRNWEKVLVQPGNVPPFFLPPVFKKDDEPCCLFVYTSQVQVWLSFNMSGAVSVQPAKVYGASYEEGDVFAIPTGNKGDVLFGRLVCWNETTHILSNRLRKYLKEKYEHNDPTFDRKKPGVGVLSAVKKDRTVQRAFWLYSPTAREKQLMESQEKAGATQGKDEGQALAGTATANTPTASPPPCFKYQDMLPLNESARNVPWRLLTSDHVSSYIAQPPGQEIVQVEGPGLSLLAETAIRDMSHLLRPAHLQQLRNILDDPEASANDRYVAWSLLKNANVAAGKMISYLLLFSGTLYVLPSCQDTGTAIVVGKKGQYVWTLEKDEISLSRGIFNAYTGCNLRYSQVAPLTMYEEKNTATNLPAQIDIHATEGKEYHFLFIAKGGGSANKNFLYQETKALLNPKSLLSFLEEKIKTLGTSACPPYHLAIVIGGTSAEMNQKTVKLASTKYLDSLPTSGNELGRGFRDLELEQQVLELTRKLGIGAQFGGKYFCHDVRVVRLPRHGASLPVGIGVSCSADRQILGKINSTGIYLEQLETDPARFLPEVDETELAGNVEAISINLSQPMPALLKELSKHPVKTRLSLSGTMIVARDIAHAKIADILEKTGDLPNYFKNHIIYYAGPAKTPEGFASGSFGPTTAGRMDSYLPSFMAHGGSLITLAKGNRGKQVIEACKKYKGFYLGSIGGAAAVLAEQSIKKVEVLEFAELGMEAVWRIEVEDFPAFIVVDDKGNDFFQDWQAG
eukprot:g74719.t1